MFSWPKDPCGFYLPSIMSVCLERVLKLHPHQVLPRCVSSRKCKVDRSHWEVCPDPWKSPRHPPCLCRLVSQRTCLHVPTVRTHLGARDSEQETSDLCLRLLAPKRVLLVSSAKSNTEEATPRGSDYKHTESPWILSADLHSSPFLRKHFFGWREGSARS